MDYISQIKEIAGKMEALLDAGIPYETVSRNMRFVPTQQLYNNLDEIVCFCGIFSAPVQMFIVNQLINDSEYPEDNPFRDTSGFMLRLFSSAYEKDNDFVLEQFAHFCSSSATFARRVVPIVPDFFIPIPIQDMIGFGLQEIDFFSLFMNSANPSVQQKFEDTMDFFLTGENALAHFYRLRACSINYKCVSMDRLCVALETFLRKLDVLKTTPEISLRLLYDDGFLCIGSGGERVWVSAPEVSEFADNTQMLREHLLRTCFNDLVSVIAFYSVLLNAEMLTKLYRQIEDMTKLFSFRPNAMTKILENALF